MQSKDKEMSANVYQLLSFLGEVLELHIDKVDIADKIALWRYYKSVGFESQS